MLLLRESSPHVSTVSGDPDKEREWQLNQFDPEVESKSYARLGRSDASGSALRLAPDDVPETSYM